MCPCPLGEQTWKHRTQKHSLEKPGQGSRSQPVTTHHGVVALPRSSVGKERMVSLMEGGITVFRMRCFLNIFNSLPYPLHSCSLFLWRGLTEVHYRSVSLWLLEEEMGLTVWKADKMQPAKCGSNGSAGIAALSLKWLSLESSKNVQHGFLHVQWHPTFACKVLCCTPELRLHKIAYKSKLKKGVPWTTWNFWLFLNFTYNLLLEKLWSGLACEPEVANSSAAFLIIWLNEILHTVLPFDQ